MSVASESHPTSVRRRVLTLAVSSLLTELGFDHAENMAIETLVEMTQSFLTEVGNSSKSYCELAGRTEPVIGDVIVALVNMGYNLEGLQAYGRRPARTTVPQPLPSAAPKATNILQAGEKQRFPAYIPNHMPEFPDPHAYIRTPTHKQPVTEYEAIREKSAQHKRDLERALCKFITKTNEVHSLFQSPDSMFPLVAVKPKFPPYLDALLPKDQIFDFEEEQVHQLPRKAKKEPEATDNKEGEEDHKEADVIDNPYLRPVKLPRKKFKLK
ncbi:Transcription initiation factor TFIID subunit 8 [Frankliniella fusca]|uniref:Transcription initiation factor TFIID subunit 8 n=1 Tax=Frankliniella fusca TaxID=407009 RepID=A0AAE1LU25_9NEOP|nr:Transcription initiation factor TFIID subunit 8 [Frankliniella fusca]